MGIDIFQVGRIVCQVPCKLQEGQAINYVDHAIVCWVAVDFSSEKWLRVPILYL